jgi:hypothetical protein
MTVPVERLPAEELDARIKQAGETVAEVLIETVQPALDNHGLGDCSGLFWWFAAQVAEEVAARLRNKSAEISSSLQ